MSEDGEAVEGLIPKIQGDLDKYTRGSVSIIDKQNGGLNSTYEILRQLSEVYPTLSDQAKAYINEAIAGNRQNKVLVAIMNNWKNVENATVSATNSLGSATIENEKYLNSIEGKISKLSRSTELFWKNLIDSNAIKLFVDSMTTLVNVFDELINNEISTFIIQSGLLTLAFVGLQKGIVALGTTSAGTAIGVLALDIAQKGLLATSKALTAALFASPLFGVMVAATAIVGTIKLIDALTTSFKEQQEIVSTLTSNINSLQTEYDSLKVDKNKTEEQKKYLLLLEKEIEYNKELLKYETQELANKYLQRTYLRKEGYELNDSKADGVQRSLDELKRLQVDLVSLENELSKGFNEKTKKSFDDTKAKILEIKTSLLESVKPLRSWIDILGEDAPSALVELVSAIESVIISEDDLIQNVETGNAKIIDMTKSISDLYEEVSTAADEYDLFTQALKELNEEGQVSKSTLDKLIEVYPNIIELTGLQKDKMIELMTTSRDKRRQMIDDEIASAKATSQATVQRILNAKDEADALTKLAQIKLQMRFIDAGNTFDDPDIDAQMQQNVTNARQALAIIESTNRKIQALEGMRGLFNEIDNKSNSKTTTSTKADPTAQADRYAKLNLALEENNNLLAKNKSLQELAGDDLEKKIPLMEEEIELTKQRQIALHNLNNERRAELLELEKTLSGQGFTFEGLGDSRVITNLDHIQGKTKEVEEQFKRYIDLQSSLLPQASQEWWNLQNTIQSVNTAIDDLAAQQRELLRVAHIKKLNEAYQDQQKALSALEEIQERIVAIIRKRGEEEMKALDLAYQKDMEQLDERHNKRKEQYAEELDEFRKMIQGKLDALNDQYEEEDYLKQLQEERDKATELQKQIDVLSLDTSLTARNQTIELRKQLAEQNKKIAEMQQKRERDLVKKSLEDQLKEKEDQVKEIEDIANDQYNNDKKRLEEDYRIAKEYHERKYSDEKVYSEARQAILDGEVEVAKGRFVELEDAFRDFEDTFGKGMGILGDIIKDEFSAKLEDAQDLLRETANLTKKLLTEIDSDTDFSDDEIGYKPPRGSSSNSGGSSGSTSSGGKISDMTSSDYMKYVAYKQLYDQAQKAGDNNAMNMANDGAKTLRKKYNIAKDLYSYNDLKGLSFAEVKARGYANGGKITETGTLIAPFHGEKNSPEWIFNDSQLKDILKNTVLNTFKIALPKIPNISGGSGGNQYQILFDVKGNLDKSIMPDIQRMITATIERVEFNKEKGFKKIGITRPV